MRLALGILLAFLSACSRSSAPYLGEIASVAPDIVLTLEVETPAFRFSAHRFRELDSFQIIIERPGTAPRTCRSDEASDRVMSDFEALRTHARIDTAMFERGPFHRLRFVTAPPMDAFETVLTLLPNGHLGLMSDGYAYELTLTQASVDALGALCDGAR
jgi:hypothetical protein